MNIYQVATLIFVFGAAGGIVNCVVLGAPRVLPAYDSDRVWHPGWAGSPFLGGVASMLIWGIYGSSASFDLLGNTPFEGHLTVAQLVTAVVVGMGGSRILTLEMQKIILRSERTAEETAKERILKATEAYLDQPKGGQ